MLKRIAEGIFFLNLPTNSFSWRAEKDKKLEELKNLLREMKNPKNMRLNPESPLIVVTYATRRAVGASLVQEIAAENGCEKKVSIYAASRSKSVEIRYSTVRIELFAVFIGTNNSIAVEDAVGVRLKMLFSLLVERDFMITTDPRPLMVLFGIQNEDLRDLIAQ
jgi:hypothetical protein